VSGLRLEGPDVEPQVGLGIKLIERESPRIISGLGRQRERDDQPLQLPTQKARDLLAYLVVFRDRPHPRAVLSGILWPDLPEGKARRRLSDTLWRVRRALGDCLDADDETIWFNTDLPCWLDMQAFENGVQDGHVDCASQLGSWGMGRRTPPGISFRGVGR
jgi:two-component SAPR family response regulator